MRERVHWQHGEFRISRCGRKIERGWKLASIVLGRPVPPDLLSNRDIRQVTCQTCRRWWLGDMERLIVKGAA